MSLTVTDLFCGAGGSSLGAEMAGLELRLGLNHWRRAIETHAANFPHADHDCADISALTTGMIRRYPDSDILLASPECTNHSLAKGGKRVKPQEASLWEDGPAGSDEQERSRATMWDVPRFAEQKLIKGRPYKAIIVENVPDAFKWGLGDNGSLFDAWLQAMTALGYEHEIVWLNSMFCPPTPQSRDRMYVVFWIVGSRRPDLRVTPASWCPKCEAIVDGQQTWKKPDGRVHGKYGQQYLYGCPTCFGTVLPGVMPAASAIDFTIEAQRIGDRDKPLADKTRERILRGLVRLESEPFALRLMQAGTARGLTLPMVTLTQRQDLAMVIPVAGNTHESSPGNRARDANERPMATIHGTAQDALVYAGRDNGVPRSVDDPAQCVTAGGKHHGVVEFQRHGTIRDARSEPVGTTRAGGFHHGVITAHYKPGWTRDAGVDAFGSVTTRDHHTLVVPYDRTGVPVEAHTDPTMTATTRDRLALMIPTGERSAQPAREWTDKDIDDARFRMFSIPEIAKVMSMDSDPKGGEYVVTGNKRERMAQYGNAVTPPVMRMLVGRVAEALS